MLVVVVVIAVAEFSVLVLTMGVVESRSSIQSVTAEMNASVACPLGKDPWEGVRVMGWICGEYSIGRRQASACLRRISTCLASLRAAFSSSIVHGVRLGWTYGMELKNAMAPPICDRISGARSPRRSA